MILYQISSPVLLVRINRVLKHRKLPKCYEQGCLKNFHCHFKCLNVALFCLKRERSIAKLFTNHSRKLSNDNFLSKPDMPSSAYIRLLNLNFFEVCLLCICFNRLKNVPTLYKTSRYWNLKETRASFEKKIFL